MYLLLVVLEDVDILPKLLERWHAIGVPGTTIVRSMGGYHAISWLERLGLTVLGREVEEETQQRLLISVIPDEELLEQAIAETEQLVGSFDRPHSGILFVLPVLRTLGVHKRRPPSPEELAATAPAPLPATERERIRRIPVSQVLAMRPIQPAIVHPEDSLMDVAQEMIRHPDARLACVVNEEGRLIGIIRAQLLASELLMHIMPEEFLQQMSELEEALEYAALFKARTAGDLMEEPVFVHAGDPIREAFAKLHKHKLPGLPVVDQTHHVIGYVDTLNMLALVTAGELPPCPEKRP